MKRKLAWLVSVALILSMVMSLGVPAMGEEKKGLGPDMLLLPTMENMSDKFPSCWDNYGLVGRMMLYSRLMRLNDKLEPVYGDLAKEWTVSDDGLQYSFTLHDNIKWHDGKDLTPDDVAYSIKYAMKGPVLNAVMRNAMSAIKGMKELLADEAAEPSAEVEGIKIDGNKISFELTEPSGTFMLSMAQFNILPRHEIEKYSPLTFKTSEYFAMPIGSGPYFVKEFKPNDYALYEAFPDYF